MTDFLGLIGLNEEAQGDGTTPVLAWLSDRLLLRDEKRG